jgi:hypothetical protein
VFRCRSLVTAASVAALVVAGLAPAARAAGSISVTASSPAASVGQLKLTFAATSAVNGFTAHIITSHGTDVLNLPQSGFSLTSGTAQSGTWTVNAPITEQQLALGSYQVTVDATDSGGDSISGAAAGTLGYLIEPTVTATASPTTISYTEPVATVSGTVTGLWPDGSTGPVANQPILSTGPDGDESTDAGGHFSFPVYVGGTFNLYVQGGNVAPAQSPAIVIKADTTPTKLTATLSTTKTSYGDSVTVSGTLTYQPGSSWQPLSGVQVVISAPGYPGSAPVTDASGHYSATFTALANGSVTVYFNNVTEGDFATYNWLRPGQVSTKALTLTLPTSISLFKATADPRGDVTASGCLGIESMSSNLAYYSRQPVIIQYALRPGGPWKKLGKISDLHTNDLNCGLTELSASFAGSFPVPAARAYYRAHFPGDAGQHWQPSTGPAILAWKYLTKISSLKVAPTHVAPGGHLTVSGQLLADTSGWKPYGHQQVLIIYRKPGKKTWYYLARATTNHSGRFTASVKDTFSATWSAYFAGNATHFFSSPAGVFVSVS